MSCAERFHRPWLGESRTSDLNYLPDISYIDPVGRFGVPAGCDKQISLASFMKLRL